MNDSKKKPRFRLTASLTIFLISILSLEFSILGSGLLETWEAATTDLRMRWCRYFMPDSAIQGGQDIVLFAIDAETENTFGKFGSGQWLSRKPFFDQLMFFEEYLRPSVLAYDIIFKERLGSGTRRQERISESPEMLKEIIVQLTKISEKAVEVLSNQTLYNIDKLSIEQGNIFLSHRFASIMENSYFHSVVGCNFRGGAVDRQTVKIRKWSDEDIFGDSESGDEDEGARIPYFKDIAIPACDVHFPKEEMRKHYGYSPNANTPSPGLLDYTFLGALNVPRESDGIVRKVPLVLGFKYFNPVTKEKKQVFVPSFSLLSCLLHLGINFPLKEGIVKVFFDREIIVHSPNKGDFHIPIDSDGRMYLNFNARFSDFDAISFTHVSPSWDDTSSEDRQKLVARYQKKIFGRIGMVGVTVTGVDVGVTPLHSNIPLVFVQMTAVNNILNRNFLAPLGSLENMILLVVLFVVFTAICQFEKTFRLGPASFLFALLYLTTAYVSMHKSWAILPVIGPLLYIGVCSFSVLSYRFFTEERAKRKIRNMFSTMVSDKILTYLEENPESFSLQGYNVETTVFFSDIADFSGISEHLSPERLTKFLNSYLTPATNAIMDQGGYVDKYVGDLIMAVWGAPYLDPDHAVKACLAALEQQRIIVELNEKLYREYGVEIHVRMGINSGIVTAGNMGSEKKFQYTVIGDVVNLASRLEPANKDFGTKIIIGESTYRMAKDHIVVRPLGKILVVGKEEIVSIYELVGAKSRVDREKLEIIRLYKEAVDHFYRRDWASCLSVIDRIQAGAQDGPSLHLRERALYCQAHPPPNDWQGEYVQLEKG